MKPIKTNKWSLSLFIMIIIFSILISAFFGRETQITFILDEIVIVLLSFLGAGLYVVGGGIIFFGSILLVSRYIQAKLRHPMRPFGTTPRVTFLTLGLEIMIGAELIISAVQRTLEDFFLLMLTILTRGLIGLILYLEKRWSHEEYEAHKEEIDARAREICQDKSSEKETDVDV